MAKERNSFVVSITTDGPAKVTELAKTIRSTLNMAGLWDGDKGGRKCVAVTKVTVTPVGEK
jgi:hypothetical protein